MVGFGAVGAAEEGCFSEEGVSFAELHCFLPLIWILFGFGFLALLVIEIVFHGLGLLDGFFAGKTSLWSTRVMSTG